MTKQLDISRRREEVLQLLMNFKGHSYIQDYIQSKYDVGKKSVERDITIAYETIKNDYPIDTQSIVEKHIAMYYDLANQAKEQYDAKGAAAILEKIEKLLKLHQPDVVINNNTQNNTLNLENISVEELKKLLNG